jgi:hypothetical protein
MHMAYKLRGELLAVSECGVINRLAYQQHRALVTRHGLMCAAAVVLCSVSGRWHSTPRLDSTKQRQLQSAGLVCGVMLQACCCSSRCHGDEACTVWGVAHLSYLPQVPSAVSTTCFTAAADMLTAP